MQLARSLGCRVWHERDDFSSRDSPARALSTFRSDAHLDHRMVMAAAVAGVAGNGCVIHGASTVSSSYPGFFEDLAVLS